MATRIEQIGVAGIILLSVFVTLADAEGLPNVGNPQSVQDVLAGKKDGGQRRVVGIQ